MERDAFFDVAYPMLAHVDTVLGDLEHDDLDVELAGDVLTLRFKDGQRFILNAHGAAKQLWLAAKTQAWHFDYVPARKAFVATKTGDELLDTLGRVVGDKLGFALTLPPP